MAPFIPVLIQYGIPALIGLVGYIGGRIHQNSMNAAQQRAQSIAQAAIQTATQQLSQKVSSK